MQPRVKLAKFKKICLVDLSQKESTARIHGYNVKKYVAFCRRRKLGYDESSIREYDPSLELAFRMAQLFKVRIEDIFSFDEK